MLALSRKKNEAIVINNDIEITVLEVKGDQVKIGITAPKEVPIYRKEVFFDSILMAVRVEDIKAAYEKLEIYKRGGKNSEETDESEID